MSSSEDEGDVGRQIADRDLFVKLLEENSVILDKSRLPKVIFEKKKAWENICATYSIATGQEVTQSQMSKMLQNMKSKIKKKSDVKATGNKKIKLKDWEVLFLSLLGEADNPVFNKVPGSCTAGVQQSESSVKTSCELSEKNIAEKRSEKLANTNVNYVRPNTKRLLAHETDETKELTTPQLQRLVLLQQYELQKLQIEKEQITIKKLKRDSVDKETQTQTDEPSDLFPYGLLTL